MSKHYTGAIKGPTPPDTLPEFEYWDDHWVEEGWPYRANLVPNPSAELTRNGWWLSSGGWTGATYEREVAPAPLLETGNGFALHVKGTHENSAVVKFLILETLGAKEGIPVTVGSTYTFSTSVYVVDPPSGFGGKNIITEIQWYKASGAELSISSTLTMMNAAELKRLSVTAVAPAEAAFAKVRITSQSNVALDTVDLWVDNSMLEKSAEVGSYFPTAAQLKSGQAIWTGAESQSESRLVTNKFADPTQATLMLYERLWPQTIEDAVTGWDLLKFCEAMAGRLFEQVRSYVSDRSSTLGWEVIFNVDECPREALPYLAQFVGVHFEPSLTVAQQRAKIKERPAFKRGTLAAIEAAAKQRLTGAKFVFLEERFEGKAYRLLIRTFTAQTPDAAGTLSDILTQKPAGIVLDYAALAMKSYAEVKKDYKTYADMKAKGTYAQAAAEP